jgi:hypothetical protein
MMRFLDQDKMLKIDPYKEREGQIQGGVAFVGNKYDSPEASCHIETG